MKSKNAFSITKRLASVCFFALLVMSPCVQAVPLGHHIHYTLLQDQQHANCIDISAQFQGNESGEYLVRIPSRVANFRFNAKGMHHHTTTSDPYVIKLHYLPSETIELNYQVCVNNPQRIIDNLCIEPNFLHLVLADTLITPDSDLDVKSDLKFSFASLPKTFHIASSFNVNKDAYQLNQTINDLRTSVITVGNFKVEEFEVNGQKVYLTSNGEWSYFDKSPTFYLKKIIKAQRDFWQDNDFPYYAIFMIKQNPPAVPRFSLGMHWKNSFSVQIPEEETMYSKALYTLSHEAFHAWLGNKIAFELNNRNLQWFAEGFNDYYGAVILLRNKLISKSDYLDILNMFIRDYYLSPVKDASNDVISGKFKLFGEYADVAQLRGHFVANMLQPNLVEHKQYPLDEAMRALLKKFQASGQKYVTLEMVDEVFNQYIGKSAWAKAKRMMTSGELLQFDPHLFAPIATLTVVEFDVPALGFDGKTLIRDSMIQNIDKKSNAFKAGLRNGQKVVNYQINFKRPEEKVVLYIKEQDKVREISFLPDVKKMKIPQYELIVS